MKNSTLKFFLVLFVLFLASCSEDDSSSGPVETLDRVLNKIITTHFKDGIEYLRVEESFLSGKLYLKYSYEGDIVVSKAEYKYNVRGQIERIKYFYDNKFEEQGNFIYDAKSRLIEFNSENVNAPGMAYSREFEYPENGTIIEQQYDDVQDPLPGGKFVYTLNESGLISKIESEDGEVFEAEFDENQIINVSAPNDMNYSYFYDEVNLDQGDFYKKYYQSIYGEDVNNGALYLSDLIDFSQVYSDKFLLSTSSDNMALRYAYALDLEGYPIERDDYNNEVLVAKTAYVYE